MSALKACLLIFLASACSGFAQIYADFQTSMGNFVAELEFEKVPTTVANFISLAEGTRSWIDPTTGSIRNRPFYSGITFHRVVSTFVIQAGSPNGLGNDGPGYGFADEFAPSLKHSTAGVLSMANSGLNSNGSQFFITLNAADHLDNKHSVFGHITEGMTVVNQIGSVVTGVNNTPVSPIVIHSVTIRRVGAAAQAFNPAQRGLPTITDSRPILTLSSSDARLTLPERPIFTQYRIFHSADLATWQLRGSLTDVATSGTSAIDVTSTTVGQARQFYQVPRATYPIQPTDIVGKTISFTRTSSGNQLAAYHIVAPPRGNYDTVTNPLGTYTLDGGTAKPIGAYLITNRLNSFQFIVAVEGLALRMNLNFRSANSGFFTAQDYFTPSESLTYWPIFGNFTISP